MEQNTSSLLPYILDLLSRQPDLSTNVDTLCEQVKDVVMSDHIDPFGTLKRAVQFALEVGMNLGIITLTEERVRVPFNFRKDKFKKRPKDDELPFIPPHLARKTLKRLEKVKPLAGKRRVAVPRPRGRPPGRSRPASKRRIKRRAPVRRPAARRPAARRPAARRPAARGRRGVHRRPVRRRAPAKRSVRRNNLKRSRTRIRKRPSKKR